MSNITLRDYHLFIDDLLEKNAMSEAIVHCTHILSSFPKSIKTYQQLGQALLEEKRYADASEVFTKVISVFPDDFVAHAGLSIVHEENRELDKAIWHMEQAFETQPSNAAIQEEFRRLISRRDGALPSKIRLTRGALIRMYAKGELYQQAIAESLSALQADPARIDLKLLLARMYTITNAENSAAEICNDILQDHPYCFEANRIMFELSSSVSDSEGHPSVFLQRLSELDPYYGFISIASENVGDVPAEKVTLEKTEYFSQEEDYSRSPEWADQIGIPWHDDAEDTVIGQVQPEPFEDLGDGGLLSQVEPPSPFIEDEVATPEYESTKDISSNNVHESELPEWIAKAGWVRANEDENPATTQESYDELPISEISDEVEAPAQPAESLPDWLQSIPTDGMDSPQLFASSEDESIPESDIPPLPPDMLAELLSDESEPFADLPISSDGTENAPESPIENFVERESFELPTVNSEEPVPNLPDWLKDLEVPETFEMDIEPAVSLTNEPQESVSVPGSVEFEISDFLAEIETSDLIGELDTIAEEESAPEEATQPKPGDLEDFEVDLNLDNKVISDQPSAIEAPDQTVSESNESEPLDVAPTESEFLEHEIEVVEHQEPEHIKTEPIKTSTPSSLPAWVKNILAGPAESTPIISATSTVGSEADAELPTSVTDSEEFIEELITDLPDEPEGAGAISEEVTAELETWLEEVDSEKTDIPTTEIKTTEIPKANEEISLESLVEFTEIEETMELVSEIDNELPIEEVALDDRLSSMFGAGDGSLIEPASVESDDGGIGKSDIERVVGLLQAGDFSSFTQEISKLSSQDEVSDQIIAELDATLQNHPENFELWQDLGDLLSRKASFDEALDAYHEAEKNIFI
jgi:tetratricopeptide (TPR) repeat protein